MKQILRAALGLVAMLPLSAFAQNTVMGHQHLAFSGINHSYVFPSFNNPALSGNKPGKASAWSVRMISEYNGEGRGGTYRNSDSAHYTYSGDRGGSIADDILNCDSAIRYQWDTTSNKWHPTVMKLNTYDSKDLCTATMTLDWNSTTSSYLKIELDSVAYSSQGNMTYKLVRKWNPGTSAWENWDRDYNMTYNASGNLLSYVSQNWDPGTSSWENSTRYTFTYDGSGNQMLTSLVEYWDAGSFAWGNQYLSTMTYDGSGLLTTETSQYWQSSALAWRNSSQYRNYYNGAGILIAQASSIGDGTGLGWVNTDSINNTSLNGAGYPLIQMNFNWNATVWQPDYRLTITYVGGNLESTITRANWNGTAFVDKQHTLNQYMGGQLTESRVETYNGSTWVIADNDDISRYRYQFSVSVPEITSSGLQWTISPNPTDAALTLQWKGPRDFNIVVYDMAGRQVMNQHESSSSAFKLEVPTTNLMNGIYILHISSGASQWQQRFVVQH